MEAGTREKVSYRDWIIKKLVFWEQEKPENTRKHQTPFLSDPVLAQVDHSV